MKRVIILLVLVVILIISFNGCRQYQWRYIDTGVLETVHVSAEGGFVKLNNKYIPIESPNDVYMWHDDGIVGYRDYRIGKYCELYYGWNGWGTGYMLVGKK